MKISDNFQYLNELYIIDNDIRIVSLIKLSDKMKSSREHRVID
jgi:hypothetical protein